MVVEMKFAVMTLLGNNNHEKETNAERHYVTLPTVVITIWKRKSRPVLVVDIEYDDML